MSASPPPASTPPASTPLFGHPPRHGPPAGTPPAGVPPVGRPSRRGSAVRRFPGLTLRARAIAVTSAVAAISVLVTALVSVPLARRSADEDRRRVLADEATVIAAMLGPRLRTPVQDEQRLARRLREAGITVVLIRDGEPDQPGLPAAVVRRVANGEPVHGMRVLFRGRPVLVEGRTLAPQEGFVVISPSNAGSTAEMWRRLWLALLAGLLAGAAAGTLLANRLAGPIRDAAAAASRLTAGDRQVRLPVKPPVEAAELAAAINELASALAISENRQRDFLLSVSHELRTPLTTLRGYAEALADGVVSAEAARRAGQTMLTEAGHLDRLIADLLVLARLEAADFPLAPTLVDLVALVSHIHEAWGARCADAGVLLRVELPPDPVWVHTDPGRIRQVIEGLLENALRVTPPGAPVILAVGTPDATQALVEVRDGGPGLSDDDLAVAFERGALYQRYQGIRKVGTGLGLALAARLVRRLNGHIEAGHAPEGGARFGVYLPRTWR